MKEWSFDGVVRQVCRMISPGLENFYVKQVMRRPRFHRLAKFAVSTFIIFWLVKGPLIWVLTESLPSINLLIFIIPSYLLAAFFAGIVITIISFIIGEFWVWKKKT